MSVGQRWGDRVGEGAGVTGRGRSRGGGGGLVLQAVEGVAARCEHHSYPGQEPAPELILVNKHTSNIYLRYFSRDFQSETPPKKDQVDIFLILKS